MLISTKNQQTLLETLSDAIAVVDREGRILTWNRAAEELTGFPEAEILGKSCRTGPFCHLDEGGGSVCDAGCATALTIRDGREREEPAFVRNAAGVRVPVLLRTAPLRDEHGRITGAVEVLRERSLARAADRKLRDLAGLAHVDALTGLPNRRSAEAAIVARLEERRRYGWNFGVLFADLDGFKTINDRYGHSTGDEFLRLAAWSLDGCLRVFDLAARWGGEEFVAVVVNVSAGELREVAERFRRQVERSSLELGGEPLSVTVSVGGTLARSRDSVQSLVDRADSLMYRSKALGRNRVSTDVGAFLPRCIGTEPSADLATGRARAVEPDRRPSEGDPWPTP